MKTNRLLINLATLTLPVFLALGTAANAETKSSSAAGSIMLKIDPNMPGFSLEQTEAQIRRMTENMSLDADQQKMLEIAIKELRNKVKSGEKFEWKWNVETNGGLKPKETESDTPEWPQQKLRRKQLGQGGQGGQGGGSLEEMMQGMLEGMFGGGRGGAGGGAGGNDLMQEMQKMMEQMHGGQAPAPGQGRGGAGGNQFMEEMQKRLMEQLQGPQGKGQGQGQQPFQRQFKFEFGPDGKLKGNGNGNGAEQNPSPRQGGQGNGGFDLQKLMGMMGGGKGTDFDPDNVDRESKYSRATLAEYRGVVKDARKSTVSVLVNGKQVALGLVVDATGNILTVASELKNDNKVEIETMDGKVYKATVKDKTSSTSKAYDIALIHVEGKDLTPASFGTSDLSVGTMLTAAGIDEDPISVGVVSVAARSFDLTRKPMLGVQMETGNNSVLIKVVIPNSPADKAGIKAADEILAFNGAKVTTPDEVMDLVSKAKVGEEVKLSIKSEDKDKDLTVKLASKNDDLLNFGPQNDHTAMMGSQLTTKAAYFPNAVQNDLGLNANQCGGPVLDLNGKVVGLNVARAGRTSTYMLSAKIVQDMLAELATGKLAQVIDPATLEQDISSYESELAKLKESLKETEQRLQKAKEAKDKLPAK